VEGVKRARHMNIQYQATNFKADQKLISFIDKKIEKLNTFHEKISDVQVYLKVNKADDKENKTVEIKMHVGSRFLFAEARSGTFEAAADDACEALRSQISKLRTRQGISG
jgi:putative sigma-54 modulation protein